jgi:tetratricopeptide (TPR) repeat protein
MQISEEIILPGQSKNENFERAEEKAIKAIQKHGMNIKGKEKNPQIDEAYLLLGKARYFDQRFVPALQAFNYILYKYPASDQINHARIWREKTNIRLENDDLAIKNLKTLMYQVDLEGQDLADATSMMAQAYINIKALDSAAWQLEVAAKATKNHDERGRYRFIQAQLYNRLNHKDSANLAFDKVIELNRKTPRAYLIAAYVGKARNFDFTSEDKEALLELLHELEANRENRPFLSKIYYQIAQYHIKNASDSLAVEFYNKSLRTNSTDKILVSKNYENLGDIFFDYTEYKIAGAYYDSTMLNMKENSKPFRTIKRKRDNLDDVILYEDMAFRNDSILGLTAMTEEERSTYFIEYTESLKLAAEEEKAKQEAAERNQGLVTVNSSNSFGVKSGVKSAGGPTPGQVPIFYFYNTSTIAYGKSEFKKIWGDRELEDNWRWGNKIKASTSEDVTDLAQIEEDNELFDPEFYLAQVPTDPVKIDSIKAERNLAYYQLGLIYKEKFKEYDLSKDKFETLLAQDPDEKLILPSKYNLYKIHVLQERNSEAETAKNEIINDYPDSRYAAILKNPDAVTEDDSSPENVYNRLYKELEKQNYQVVINECNKYISTFEGESIVPKFELLKANAIGRLNGFDEYSKAIGYVAYNFANTPEGAKAQTIADELLPKLATKEFIDNPEEKHFKIVYYFDNPTEEEIKKFTEKLQKIIEKVYVFDLSLSVDIYNSTRTFVVVHGLTSKEGAQGYAGALEERKEDKIIHQHFATSSSNYKIIQVHKNMDEYLSIE